VFAVFAVLKAKPLGLKTKAFAFTAYSADMSERSERARGIFLKIVSHAVFAMFAVKGKIILGLKSKDFVVTAHSADLSE